MKETPFRPPQPCPLPARTPLLPPGLSAAPVPAAQPAANSNLLRSGHVDRQRHGPAGGLPPSVGGDRKGRSCWALDQAAIRAASEARGAGNGGRQRAAARPGGGWGGGPARTRHGRGGASARGLGDRARLRTTGVTYISPTLLTRWCGSPPETNPCIGRLRGVS